MIDAGDLQLQTDPNSLPIFAKSELDSNRSAAPTTGDKTNRIDYPARCAEYPSLDDYLLEVEKEILCDALEKVRWNKTLAAKRLGITFRSLRYRLQKLGLDDE